MFHREILKDEKKLWEAVKEGQVERIRRLLSSGMLNMNCVGGTFGLTPLLFEAVRMCGSEATNIRVVKLLLEKGADPNKADDYFHRGPLKEAIHNGNKDVVKLLLDKGAEPNKMSRFGNYPLKTAAQLGNRDIVRMLLKAGADPNVRDWIGFIGSTPLQWASRNGHEDVVQELLAAGAEPSMTEMKRVELPVPEFMM